MKFESPSIQVAVIDNHPQPIFDLSKEDNPLLVKQIEVILQDIQIIEKKLSAFGTQDNDPTYATDFQFSKIIEMVNDLKQKTTEFLIEEIGIYQQLASYGKSREITLITEKLANLSSSLINYSKLLDFQAIDFLTILKPEVDFDDDGELVLEWYGRKGARANLTFGRNGELYFVSLFHGSSLKAKLFINQDSINQITNEINKLSEDMDS
jgi:hypothetical protein